MNDVFSPTLILAPLTGLGIGLGLVLLIASLIGWPRKQGQTGPSATERFAAFLRRRAAAAVIAGLIVLALSNWLVAAIGVGLLVLFWRQLFGGAGEERAALAKVEALAAWTESLRDTIAGAAGLEQAIGASARSAAPILRPHLIALNDRLRTRMPLTQALDLLAEELADGGADQVIAALKQSAGLRGAGLREVLGALAINSRAEVDMRRRIFAGRAGPGRGAACRSSSPSLCCSSAE